MLKHDSRGIGVPRTRSFSLNVTKNVIENAEKKNSKHCMIADALRNRGASSVLVTAEGIRFNHDGMRYTYPMPVKCAVKLINFDNGKKVEPFTMVLNGNTGFCRPVETREASAKPKKSSAPAKRKKRSPQKEKRTNRRYMGLRVIETNAAA